jgi:hypothetical protein
MARTSFEREFSDDLDKVRKVCERERCFSWTSAEYQSDVLNFVYENRDKGGAIVEVGCYKGGLAALFALLCQRFGFDFYTMDIDPTAIDSTKGILAKIGLDQNVLVFHGSLPTFVSEVSLSRRPVLNLDGDHAYEAVMADIQAIERLRPRAYAVSFHDHSLRHPTTDERVDDAIRNSFEPGIRVTPIGMRMTGENHPTEESPFEDGHYWAVPGSEGALLILPPTRSAEPQRAGSQALKRVWRNTR